MPVLNTRLPPFQPAKDVTVKWDGFKKGLNTILRDTELENNELAEADNLMLTGKGVPTNRWGTSSYNAAGAAGSVRALFGYYPNSGTNELVFITDDGMMAKKSGASYTPVLGASWASGSNIDMAQLDDSVYIVSDDRELVRYSTPTLYSFPTISTPGSVFATNISGASGTNTLSYRVSAYSDVGETLASSAYTFANQPQDLSEGTVKVSWAAVSTASGVLKGYNIYGRNVGDERFLGSVNAATTGFLDAGEIDPRDFAQPPLADSTGGVKGKYVTRWQDRLVYAGIDGDPTKVVISAKWPNHERNDIASGGNYIKVEPDSGDDITGIESFEDKLIVFKERSVWEITLTGISLGNFYVYEPVAKVITKSHGCIAPRSIKTVENDIFFLTRNGVYALGYEPNVLNVLRTSEISARVRPFFDGATTAQKKSATAFYYDFKYGISFPGKNQTMVYDRERLAWMGPWSTDANIYEKYYDSSDDEILVFGDVSGPTVKRYDEGRLDDDGSSFSTILRTNKEDYGDWTLFKNIKDVFMLFRNVQGSISVDIRLQDRKSEVTTAKSFTVSTVAGNAGWGADIWADTLWGDSEMGGGAADVNEIYREAILNKASRNVQLIVKTTNANDRYELLQIQSTAKPLSKGFIPSSERV